MTLHTLALKTLWGSRYSVLIQYYSMQPRSGFYFFDSTVSLALKSVLCFCIISAASTLSDVNINMNCYSKGNPERQQILQASGNSFALMREIEM